MQPNNQLASQSRQSVVRYITASSKFLAEIFDIRYPRRGLAGG